MTFDRSVTEKQNVPFFDNFRQLSLASSHSMQYETADSSSQRHPESMPEVAPCSYIGPEECKTIAASSNDDKIHRVSLKALSPWTPDDDIEYMHSQQQLRRRRILARKRHAQAFEKLSPQKQAGPFIRVPCENYLLSLAYTQIKVLGEGFFHTRSQSYLDAAHEAIATLPYELSDDKVFYQKYIRIKDRLSDTLNKIGNIKAQAMQCS